MPVNGPKFYSCILCSKRTKPKERRKVNKPVTKFLRKQFLTEAKADDTIFSKCLLRTHRLKPQTCVKGDQNSFSVHKENDPPGIPDMVSLPIPSCSRNHAYCFVCKRPGPKLVVVTSSTRFQVFLYNNILIPAASRCCPAHLDSDGMFLPECLNGLKTTDSTMVDSTTKYELLQKLRNVAKRNSVIRLDFDSTNILEDADYVNLTGLSCENADELCEHVTSKVRNTPARSTRTSLGIFLMKLRSGISNKLLSTLFNLTKSSVRRAVDSVRRSLMTSFVPQNLGLQHVTRESVITEHTRPLAQKLFGNESSSQVILVLDGTYIYIQKSNNFAFQRRSFSFHKGRPLMKPMIVVTTSGYFVTVMGPYLADQKNNDASILNHMMKTNVEDIKTWVNEEDVFIVDRGFRDSLALLEELGIQAEMPAFMNKGEKQMSTENANASRLVTKVSTVKLQWLEHLLNHEN